MASEESELVDRQIASFRVHSAVHPPSFDEQDVNSANSASRGSLLFPSASDASVLWGKSRCRTTSGGSYLAARHWSLFSSGHGNAGIGPLPSPAASPSVWTHQ